MTDGNELRSGEEGVTLAKPPSLSLWLREIPHTVQIAASPLRRVSAQTRKQGNGEPVMVFPGILSSDKSTSLLRRTLDRAGYIALASKLGFVTGVTPETFARAEARLHEAYAKHAKKVVLLGWSLGGIYARVLAQRYPQEVAMVVTMGTPFSGDRKANNAWRIYNTLNDHTVDTPKLPGDPSVKPAVQTVAVWSANDGVIAPECARGLQTERDVEIEVPFRHFAMGSDKQAIDRIVAILAEQISA